MQVSFGQPNRGPGPTAGSNAALGMGCVALFLLPFGAVGLGTIVLAIQRALSGNRHDALFFLLFGLVFGGVAATGWTLLLIGRRNLEQQERLRARHPDQPWMWRQDWAAGRISDSSRSTMWGSWAFSTLWNLISFPTGYLALRAAQQEGNGKAYIGLLFPLVGSGLLIWAIRNTLRHRRFGTSVLELSTLPGTIGHRFAGQVRASGVLQSVESFAVTLSCINRVTSGSGKNQSTSERILWQEEQRVRAEAARDAGGMFTRIRIEFRLPQDARATDSTSSRDQILWRLSVSADVPGVDYASTFEVPVFRTAASDLPPTEDDLRLDRVESGPYQQPRDSRVLVSRTARGTEISFPAARSPGAASFLTLFAAAWGALVAGLIYLKAPVLFPVVFGLFELLLLIGALQLWLGVSRVTVRKGALGISQGYLAPGAERTVAAAEVGEITTRINMQIGNRPYYDVVVVTRNGKKIAAGRWLRDKREAEWLAATMREEVGLGSISPAEPGSRTLQSSTNSAARHAR